MMKKNGINSITVTFVLEKFQICILDFNILVMKKFQIQKIKFMKFLDKFVIFSSIN